MVICKRITLCFVLIGSVLGEQGLLNPCDVEDMACLSKSTQQFLNNTATGIPQYDIRAIDPMVIPLMESDLKAVKYTYSNLTLHGLKDLNIADFKMDLKAKTVLLKTNINVNYGGNIGMDFRKPVKSFSGTYSGSGKALMTSIYPYLLKTDDKGVEHFEVGKEEITCEALEADADVSEELTQQLNSDPDIREMMKKVGDKRDQMVKSGLCKIMQVAYPNVIHNIRASAKILPKTAFFKNI